jgi:predicted GNAT family acetyltransferase
MADVSDNQTRNRYEMLIDGQTAFVTYTRQGGDITLLHTEVPAALNGRGIGSQLARAVLQDIRDRGLRVIPECEFIASYIQRNPELASPPR